MGVPEGVPVLEVKEEEEEEERSWALCCAL